MSYEVVGRKVISTSSVNGLGTNVANYIISVAPEFKSVYSKTGTYDKNVYLQYKETKAGFGLHDYGRYNIGSNSNYYGFFIAKGISSSGGTNIHSGSNLTQYGYYYTTVNSTIYVNVEVVVVKLANGYFISLGGFGFYFGDYISPIYGKCMLGINFNGLSCDTYNIPAGSNNSNYYYGKVGFVVCGEVDDDPNYYSPYYAYYREEYYKYSGVFSEDGSNVYHCCGVTFTPNMSSISDYSAILSPMYVPVRDIWIEPILLPDIYYMSASNYPGLYEEAQVGDVTAYRMTNNGRIVVI